MHEQTDEKCLELAHDVRVVLIELSERLGQALKDEAELDSAVSRLMKARQDQIRVGGCVTGGSTRIKPTATRWRAGISGRPNEAQMERGNPFYEWMREVSPGDLIFSFMDTRIQAIGIAQSYCWESPKPWEFGTAGQNWEDIGWKVKVAFTALATKIRPKDHIDVLRPLLPERYSPLQPNGNGLQSVYLTELPADLAEVLLGLIGAEVEPLALTAKSTKPVVADDLDLWEGRIEREVATNNTLPETDRMAIIRARRGQGTFQGSREPN